MKKICVTTILLITIDVTTCHAVLAINVHLVAAGIQFAAMTAKITLHGSGGHWHGSLSFAVSVFVLSRLERQECKEWRLPKLMQE